MKEAIISSSVLILCIVLLRQLCKGKISARLQYLLWLVVAVRLILPGITIIFPNILPSTDFSVMNAADRVEEAINPDGSSGTLQLNLSLPASGLPFIREASADGPTAVFVAGRMPQAVVWLDILKGFWCFGMVVTGLWLLAVNIRFMRRLRKDRVKYEYEKEDFKLPIYLVKDLSSPCLYGLPGRQAVYLPEDLSDDAEKVKHILAHEYCHYRHGDVFWSALRSILVMVYWFHPLVWLAAVLSRQDCELACDEASIRLLGEEERIAYGKTLVSLITRKTRVSDIVCTATTMTSGAGGIKERVSRIAENPRKLAVMLIPVLVVVGVVISFTFTQAKNDSKNVYLLEGKDSMMVTTDCFQMTFPDSLANKAYYRIENDTDVIVYHKDSDREIGRFRKVSYEEAMRLADQIAKAQSEDPQSANDLALIGIYGDNLNLRSYINGDYAAKEKELEEKENAVRGTDSNTAETTYAIEEMYGMDEPGANEIDNDTTIFVPDEPTQGMLDHSDIYIEEDDTTYIYDEDKNLAAASSGGPSPIPAPEDTDSEAIHLPYNENEDSYVAEDVSDYLPNEEITVTYIPEEGITTTTEHQYYPAENVDENVSVGTDSAAGEPEVVDSKTYLPNEVITETYTPEGDASTTEHYYIELKSNDCYLYVPADNSDADDSIRLELIGMNQILYQMADSVTVLYISEESMQEILESLTENRFSRIEDYAKPAVIVNKLPETPGLGYMFLGMDTITEDMEATDLILYYWLKADDFTQIDGDNLFMKAVLMFASIENLNKCSFIIVDRSSSSSPLESPTMENSFERSGMEELFGPLYPCSETKEGLTDLYNRVLEYLN